MAKVKEEAKTVLPRKCLGRLLRRMVESLDRMSRYKRPVAEAVHRLRVDCRRAQAGLKLFRPWLPRKRRKNIEDMIRRVRRACDRTRRMDVIIQKLEGSKPGKPRRIWLSAVQKDREKDMKKMLLVIRDAKDASVSKVRALVDRGREDSAESIHGKLRERVRALLARTHQSMGSAGRGEESIHRLRIASKKARYGLEITQFLWSNCSYRSVVVLLEEIQERLGILNDQLEIVQDLQKRATDAPGGPWQELLDRQNCRKEANMRAVVSWLESIHDLLVREIGQLQAVD